MKCSTKIIFSVLLLCGVFTSCVKDKGNYDYSYVQSLGLRFAQDSIIVSNGAVLTITPILYDKTTGSQVNVNYDDYAFEWRAMEYGKTWARDQKFLSDKYNLDEPIVLPIKTDYHTIYLKMINIETGQSYAQSCRIRTIGALLRSYLFLTEDESKNVELEFYGWNADNNIVHYTNYLSASGFPYTTGGANAIVYDKFYNRMYIATGSGLSWLDTPDFSCNPEINKISEWLIPTTTNTFKKMIRFGNTGSTSTSRAFMCFTDAGEFHVVNNTGIIPSIALRGLEKVEVSPMVGGNHHQKAIIVWDNTNKELTWANMMSMGMMAVSRSLTKFDPGIAAPLKECLFMDGSTDREMIAVLKDVNNTIWRVDAKSFSPDNGFMSPYYAVPLLDPRELVGTAALGQIDHWFCSREKGYLYAIVNNTLRTYVESQAGGVADPGWTNVNIKDKSGATVTFKDPISFVWSADNGTTDNMNTCFYIVTYSAANGGTVYRLVPKEVGSEVELLEKFEGFGNIKQMCYWWG